jgi:hypothetical protein
LSFSHQAHGAANPASDSRWAFRWLYDVANLRGIKEQPMMPFVPPPPGGDEGSKQPASAAEGESLQVKSRQVHCLICGHDRFWCREAQLNTAVATFFGFDWANASGICYVCNDCGYIHWFLPRG